MLTWSLLLLGLTAPGEVPSFARDVQPLLAEHCIECHGPDRAERRAGLRLDTEEGLLGVVERGRPVDSELVRRVRTQEADERMPPVEHGEGLTDEEVRVLERWIEAGAAWEGHWAYAPFREVVPPEGEEPHPIDRFVAARLEREGLALAPEADRRTLIRRLTLDLHGLPPTPAEVEAFLADGDPGAYERLVDRLLGSVRWAERFARHWLDLARYADSHGFTIDGPRSMWPWRDWVIEALDQGMPYDRFTVLQLAGDLVEDATPSSRLATGFHRNTQINQEGGAKDEENRIAAVHDRVETTAAVWLGSTLSCARCHDHKYDPLSQEEYYRLFAFFDSTADGGVSAGPAMTLADAEQRAALEAHEAELARREREVRRQEQLAAGDFRTWRPARWIASNGPELRLEEDGSLLAVGHHAAFTVYTLDGPAPEGTTGFLRLEALADPRLPAGGPGRAGNGNLVLERVRVLRREGPGAPWRELELASARADHEQDTRSEGGGHYPAADVLRPEGGWAVSPAAGRPHVLLLELARPLVVDGEGGGELRVELHQGLVNRHALGRLRLSVGAGPAPDELVPPTWSEAVVAWLEEARARPSLPTSLVLEERAEPRTTRIFERGNFLTPGAVVRPGFPAALDHFSRAEDGEPRTRLDLARWLVHPENALAHRVTVNRHWQRLFGTGLVETENDLGLRGALPSHPDLLEWLARQFVGDGMDLKALQRLIVTSRTYRQSSHHRADAARVDVGNRLLARQSALRLEAEAIRDSALLASGLLVDRVGGPPVQPPQPEGVFAFTQSNRRWEADGGEGRFRRSLYTRIWRSAPHPFFTTFDAPQPTVTCTRRRPSQTPLQALTLANDPMVLELAAGLGERLVAAHGDDEERAVAAFEHALAREPRAQEREVLLDLVARRRAEGEDEVAAWTAAARVLFNTAEFVTRP